MEDLILLGESIRTAMSQERFQGHIEKLIARMGASHIGRLDSQDTKYPSVEGYAFESEGAFSINYFREPMDFGDSPQVYRGRLVPLGLNDSKMKMLEDFLQNYIPKRGVGLNLSLRIKSFTL